MILHVSTRPPEFHKWIKPDTDTEKIINKQAKKEPKVIKIIKKIQTGTKKVQTGTKQVQTGTKKVPIAYYTGSVTIKKDGKTYTVHNGTNATIYVSPYESNFKYECKPGCWYEFNTNSAKWSWSPGVTLKMVDSGVVIFSAAQAPSDKTIDCSKVVQKYRTDPVYTTQPVYKDEPIYEEKVAREGLLMYLRR